MTMINECRLGRGGLLHRFAIDCIEESLSSEGWDVRREVSFDVAGEKTFVDAVATASSGLKMYIEFERRVDYALINVSKDLCIDNNPILVVTGNRKLRQAVMKSLSTGLTSQEMARIQFPLLSAFLRSNCCPFPSPNKGKWETGKSGNLPGEGTVA